MVGRPYVRIAINDG
jgi:hypothetical protein